MFDLKMYLHDRREAVNRALKAIMARLAGSGRLAEAMRYSLFAGGKRVRPILCLSAAEAVGGDPWQEAMTAGCAIEMIHTFSLIHDDLPALDDDDLRRGRPTCHKAFDEPTAILAGDALLNLAFQVLTEYQQIPEGRLLRRLAVVHRIAEAVGHMGMIEGQMRDMEGETRPLSIEDLEAMHRLKTGALITASVHAGGVLGGGSVEQIEALCTYGENVGLAFQVTDDILNVEGDPVLMGKAVGTDASRKKTTYPSLLGLDKAKTYGRNLVSRALNAIAGFGTEADSLRQVARYIVDRHK